jgi:hypothetical protein
MYDDRPDFFTTVLLILFVVCLSVGVVTVGQWAIEKANTFYTRCM